MDFCILKREEINTVAWNRCIAEAPLSLVYAFSWYLDALCNKQWAGLILGDYEGVMPLCHKKKFGITYLYQPYFCQQLGLFGAQQHLPEALSLLRSKYRFADVNFHTGSPSLPDQLRSRTTFWLSLNKPYESISAGYHKDARKNLRRLKEKSGNYQLETTQDYRLIIRMFRRVYGNMNPKIRDKDYENLQSALHQAELAQAAEAFLIRAENGDVLAGGIFLKSREHYHYVLGGPFAKDGVNGVHALIDEFIRLHAGETACLDFEGSDIPSVAAFYRKFGSVPVPYFNWKLNRLPIPLRWLKR